MPADSRLPAALRAFRHRDFRLFWFGQLVSLIGTWMQSVAQSWLVLELTNSPFRLGLVGTLQFAPVLFLSFFAGALADRLPKRRLLIATQSLMCAQALVLAALVTRGHVQYWHVALMAAVYGLANTVDMPTRQAFIVEMVGRESLRSAIALNSTLFNGARVVGPALAGLVIARWGTGLAFFFNYNTLVPLLARDILHQDAHGFGLLMTAVGGGAVAGAIALASLGTERPPATVLVGSAVALGVATILVAGVSRFGVAMALLTVMGFCGMVFMTGANTTVQLTVPDELRGRVMALHTLMFAGMTPFGAFLVGTVTEALGARAGFLVTGAGGLVSVVAVSLWWRWYRRRR